LIRRLLREHCPSGEKHPLFLRNKEQGMGIYGWGFLQKILRGSTKSKGKVGGGESGHDGVMAGQRKGQVKGCPPKRGGGKLKFPWSGAVLEKKLATT